MADNRSYIKISVFYSEGQKTISSNNISALDDRIILRGEDFDLVPHKSIVDVAGYLKDGVVFMSGRITLSTTSQVNLDIIKTDNKQERRTYLKVKADLKTKLLRAYSKGKRKRSYRIDEVIQTRDISLGGIAFFSNRTLLKKQMITIDFNSIKPGFIAKAEILRKERGPFAGFRFKYGCRFLDVGGEEERVLCEFVFKKQLENHRKLTLMQDDMN
ncbi:MAG: hypothetical protein K0R19_436 [Bacillota bacterium]|nr:hypothetical protein [Bacillota bacterium]